MKIRLKANAVFDGAVNFFALLAILLLVFVMLAVNAEIIMRYFLGSPMIWVTEVTEYCILWMTFLGATWVLKKEGHVVMDVVINQFNPRIRARAKMITSFGGAAICLILTWYGVEVTLDFYQRSVNLASTLDPPAFPLYTIMPMGSFLLFIQFLKRAFGFLSGESDK
ncbi:TRAP transporter small permease [Thermodesulfobacteriota bacterium]